MTNEQITAFLKPEYIGNTPIQISFKTRPALRGLFIETNDFGELKSKNLWRIVSESKITAYIESKDVSLARIFNGIEISRLTLPTS